MPFLNTTKKIKAKSYDNTQFNPTSINLTAYPPDAQYSFAEIVGLPILKNSDTNTDKPRTTVASTMVDRDLIKMINRGMNTDLVKDKVKVYEPKFNHYNEGFKTYYDNEADVLGVDCFMCCNNCWGECNNVCKGCRNSVSCPVYCWLFFIAPIFLILITGIIIGILIGTQTIQTNQKTG